MQPIFHRFMTSRHVILPSWETPPRFTRPLLETKLTVCHESLVNVHDFVTSSPSIKGGGTQSICKHKIYGTCHRNRESNGDLSFAHTGVDWPVTLQADIVSERAAVEGGTLAVIP